MDYKKAGVDIEAGYRSVELIKKHVKETMRPEVLGGIGGFAGAFSLSAIKDMEDPVLLSGTDGCGTKVQLAFVMDKHDTIGIDCVAMCVNDIACAGGEPLFFLDYIACGKNYPEKIATIVSGVAEGCKQSGAALVGGETAEHPGHIGDHPGGLGFPAGTGLQADGLQRVEHEMRINLRLQGMELRGGLLPLQLRLLNFVEVFLLNIVVQLPAHLVDVPGQLSDLVLPHFRFVKDAEFPFCDPFRVVADDLKAA